MFFKRRKSTRISKADVARSYAQHPSLAHRLPWRDYYEEHQVFLLQDLCSLGVGFEITPIACEARPPEMLEAIHQSLKNALQHAIPFEKEHPWILQIFVQRNTDLSWVLDKITQAIPEQRRDTPLVQAHLTTLKTHLDYVSQPGGIFVDTDVTQCAFQGGQWHIYAVLYRPCSEAKPLVERERQVAEILRLAEKLAAQWQACGLGVKRLTGSDFYQWLVRWFNPKRPAAPYPEADNKPTTWDLSEQLFFSTPESCAEGWLFDGMPHQVLTIQSIRSNPVIGHLSAERASQTDHKVVTLIDHLPEGSVLTLTVVLQAPSEVAWHLKQIQHSAVGHHALAIKVKTEVQEAETAMAEGDYLIPLTLAVYLRGENLAQLQAREAQVEVLLNSHGFHVITDQELFPSDAYLRYLPMNYDFALDRKYHYRSRYVVFSDVAKLLPFYGRSRGTGNPGMLMFNRGGEPWFYDLLQDRTKNAHFLLLGETGTGKSNTLNFLILHHLALYNPRFFILDAGGSFDLLADYCQSLGLSVNKVKIDPKHPVSLNPFHDGLKVLDQLAAFRPERISADLLEESEGITRDILGDMVLAALVMMTGGEPKEEQRIRRSDRLLMMEAIISAAEHARQQQRTQLIAQDIVAALERVSRTLDPLRERDKIRRSREMADGLRYFIRDPLGAQFFNTEGQPWPLADITVVDFGLFAQEGYEAQRAIAFCGVFNKIQALAEANQYSNRPLISVLDENHIFSKVPLLAALETRGAKMGRKLGWWLWIATQNMTDFAEEAHKMLSMIETWMCLSSTPDEIAKIEKFKSLTRERRQLLLSARKAPGQYTEAVVLSPKHSSLFRSIPPALYLAMAATEQHEKHARQQLMQQLGCTELAAVQYQAQQRMKIAIPR